VKALDDHRWQTGIHYSKKISFQSQLKNVKTVSISSLN